jgi:hypothetical protein
MNPKGKPGWGDVLPWPSTSMFATASDDSMQIAHRIRLTLRVTLWGSWRAAADEVHAAPGSSSSTCSSSSSFMSQAPVGVLSPSPASLSCTTICMSAQSWSSPVAAATGLASAQSTRNMQARYTEVLICFVKVKLYTPHVALLS